MIFIFHVSNISKNNILSNSRLPKRRFTGNVVQYVMQMSGGFSVSINEACVAECTFGFWCHVVGNLTRIEGATETYDTWLDISALNPKCLSDCLVSY